MSTAAVRGVVRQLGLDADGPSDAALLTRFVRHRDEAAFAEILRRHGPVVLGTCRRVLTDSHAAEDAFQAVFLVLARRAGAGRPGPSAAGCTGWRCGRRRRRRWPRPGGGGAR
jgi:hypothetical protein